MAMVGGAAELVTDYRFGENVSSKENLIDQAGDIFYNFLLYRNVAEIDPVVALERTFSKIEDKYQAHKSKGSARK